MTIAEMIIPLITTGLLFPVMFIFVYIYIKFKQRIYLAIMLLASTAFLYVIFDLFTNYIGGMQGQISAALQFNRLQELSVGLFIPLLPYFLNSILSLNRSLRSINRWLLLFGAAFCLLLVGVAFTAPDLFISVTVQRANTDNLASAIGRGAQGIAFQIRDIVLLLLIVYSIILISTEMVLHREFNYLMQFLIGFLVAIVFGVSALIKNFTGVYFDPLGDFTYSRVGLSVTIFVLFGLSAYIRYFLNQAKLVQAAHDVLSRKEAELQHMAYYDELTGLMNRKSFFMRTARHLNQARVRNEQRGFLLVDLDNFGAIVDAYGEEISDYLLKLVADRIADEFGDSKPVFRTGGDEFAIIPDQHIDSNGLIEVADRLMQVFKLPFVIGIDNLFLSISIGLALFPDDGDSPEELFKNAMRALSTAKTDRNRYTFYSPEMALNASRRLKLIHGLRESLNKEEFTMFYQPVLDRSGTVTSAEALVRWTHPEYQHISPSEFIPLAELTGLILPLSEWILNRVAADLVQMQAAGLDIKVHINLSAKQFKGYELCRKIIQQFTSFQIDSTSVCFEVTESSLVENFESVKKDLECLQQEGFSISLDDFGTGYSSLSYLRELPFDTLKIDKVFIRKLHNDENTRALVASIIKLAQQLEYRIVAEGVERLHELEFLQQHSCDYYQGYLISHPLPLPMLCDFASAGFQLDGFSFAPR
ncbi:MAG: putative bifunctional diguanylate cyclase/phosphodiesterase [Spirochaetota bacterium]